MLLFGRVLYLLCVCGGVTYSHVEIRRLTPFLLVTSRKPRPKVVSLSF